jgi:hypothetical protein
LVATRQSQIPFPDEQAKSKPQPLYLQSVLNKGRLRGQLLARSSKHILFRSGNATGSDEYFSKGVSSVDARRLEIITPYKGHRKAGQMGYATHNLDDINLLEEPEVVYGTKRTKSLQSAVDQYVSGVQNRGTAKAAYLIRDTIKVVGTRSGISKATFAIFYVDLSNPGKGGTGHTMRVCVDNDVPFITQDVWMGWVV